MQVDFGTYTGWLPGGIVKVRSMEVPVANG
jgi:hypothetical protein